jgi:hypothetical protein
VTGFKSVTSVAKIFNNNSKATKTLSNGSTSLLKDFQTHVYKWFSLFSAIVGTLKFYVAYLFKRNSVYICIDWIFC